VRGKRRRFRGPRLGIGLDDGVDLVVGVSEVEFLAWRFDPLGQQIVAIKRVPACLECAFGEHRPIELRHLPRLARVVVAARRSNRGRSDFVGVDVVGVAVSAVGVIGYDDVGTQLANDGDQRPDGLAIVGVDEPLPTPLRGAEPCPSHASGRRRRDR